jgi:hypothetical protein
MEARTHGCHVVDLDILRRYELLSCDEDSLSINDKKISVRSNSTTIIRFIGNSDSSTNLDAFDPMVLITGICEQILTTRCPDDDVSCRSGQSTLFCSPSIIFVFIYHCLFFLQGHAKYFRQRLDQADAYANVCSLLIEMVLQFNVRIILDGLDELENRFAIALWCLYHSNFY